MGPLEIIDALGVWTWWVAAAILLVLELIVPGVFFLWLAIAAAIVGAISLLVVWPWQSQVATFAVLSLVSLIGSRMFLQRQPIETDRPFLNRRADALLGKEFVLAGAIVAGEGRMKVGDSIWPVHGPDLPKGARVRVREVQESLLVVEAV